MKDGQHTEAARENALLRRTIRILEERLEAREGELRRVRRKLAEWEGSMRPVNGLYHHGSRAILPFVDEEEGSQQWVRCARSEP